MTGVIVPISVGQPGRTGDPYWGAVGGIRGRHSERRVAWRERRYPSQRWRRLFVRTIAQADVLAPDSRSYAVRVIRVLWPRGRWSDISADWQIEAIEAVPSMFLWRVGWGVRVLGAPGHARIRPLVYGEELLSPDAVLLRGREIAEGLSEGRRP
jgi:hypothetical protein